MAKKSNTNNFKKAAVTSKKKQSKTNKLIETKKTNAANKEGNSNRDEEGEGGDDWLTNLVKVSSKTDSDSKLIGTIRTKAERIEKRNAKKRRRDERKGTVINNNKDPSIQHPFNNHNVHAQQTIQRHPQNQKFKPKVTASQRKRETKTNLEKLKSDIKEVVASISRKRRVPYQDANALIKGKATAKSSISNASQIQPRKNDYNGLGLARPSLFLSLFDDSFIPKLEEEFAEHVEGFFGKQRTKAMKKQLDGNMLWRKLLKQKSNHNNSPKESNNEKKKNNNNIRINGKKLSDMTPDERVEAMIKAGMI